METAPSNRRLEQVGNLEAQARAEILKVLQDGGLRAGEPIMVRELSKRLGMSRTPVRAALGRLHEQGLVEYDGQRGFTAPIPTPSTLVELFDLRLMCELHALRRLAVSGRAPSPRLNELAEEGLRLATAVEGGTSEYTQFRRNDTLFHEEIISLADNGRLADWYERLNLSILVTLVGWTAPMTQDRYHVPAREHAAVAAAIVSGDIGEASMALEAHIRRIRDQTVRFATGSDRL